jgi:hypothetical protein
MWWRWVVLVLRGSVLHRLAGGEGGLELVLLGALERVGEEEGEVGVDPSQTLMRL